MEWKVDNETANAEFERFCDLWEIDSDIESMSNDDKSGFESQKSQLIKAIKRGRLSVNDDGTLNYTFSDFSEKNKGETITIKRPKGSAYMEMDGFNDKQMIRKTYAILAGMTGKAVSYYSNVDGVDLKALQAVITLFLAG
jgi:hypothetical protein